MRHAIINSENKVVNVIIWDGVSNWVPPIGCSVINCIDDKCDIDDIYDPEINSFTKKDQ